MQLTQAFVDIGIDCQIIGARSDFSVPALPLFQGLKVITFPVLCKRFHFPLVSLSRLRKVVKEVDLIHIIGHWSALNALIFLAAKLESKPYVVCPAGALLIYGRSKGLKHIYNWLIGQRIIKNAAGWIAITSEERSQFLSYGISLARIMVIPNGINPKNFLVSNLEEFRARYDLGSAPFLLFIGRLNSIKGPDILLEAFCKNPTRWKNYHLVFAGPDGGLLAKLMKRVHELRQGKRVHFLGYINGHEKTSAYKCAELLVIPSRHEAMSIVVLESGICGTPVLMTDQCGFDSVQAVGGGVVKPATIEGIEAGLNQLLCNEVDLEAMGRKLHSYVASRFTWADVVAQYIELYKQIIFSK